MAGLNCATVSHVAWRYMTRGVDLFLAIEEEYLRPAVKALEAAGILAGETGAAGLAGLRALADGSSQWAAAARIGPGARVAVICTGGITDPVSWRQTTSSLTPTTLSRHGYRAVASDRTPPDELRDQGSLTTKRGDRR